MRAKYLICTIGCFCIFFGHQVNAQSAGNALNFDGSDDYVDLTVGDYLTNSEGTFEAWIKPVCAGEEGRIITITDKSEGSDYNYFSESGCKVVIRIREAGSDFVYATTVNQVLSAGSWSHIVYQQNGSGIQLFVDGIQITNFTVSSGSLTTTAWNDDVLGADGATIGVWEKDAGKINYFEGTIDEVRIWNTDLSQSTIQDWMFRDITTDHPNYSNSAEDNLKAYYKMSDGSDTSLSDNSANSNTGTLEPSSGDYADWVSSYVPLGNIQSGYTTNIKAIWQSTGTDDSGASDGLWMSVSTQLAESNFGVFGNNNTSSTSTSDLPSGVSERTGRIWYVDESGTVSANLTFDIGDVTGNTVTAGTASNYKLLYRSGTSGDFTNQASGSSVANTDQVTFNSVSLQDGYYALGGTEDASLPVGLSDFRAIAGNGQVVLKWITESELDNLGFNIYRSKNSNDQFSMINDQLIPGAGNSSKRHDYEFVDNDVINGITYWYKLEDVDFAGNKKFHKTVSTTPLKSATPTEFRLYPNYPNPFNPVTAISYDLPDDGYVVLSVYNMIGEEVTTLIKGNQNAGSYILSWDGIDRQGRLVPSGIYFLRIESVGYLRTHKMVFIR